MAFELGLHDLHPEILRLMGRLKFRTSYGQNVLTHSRGSRAPRRHHGARSSASTRTSPSRAAFLHDIGKAIDREMQGTHLELGIDFLRKHGESEPVRDGDGRASHGHRLAVARSDDRAGRRRDLRGASGRAPRHPRVLRQAAREARGHRRLVQGRVEVVRAAGRPRDPHHGRERERSPTRKRSGCRRTSPGASRTSSNIPGRSRSRSSARPAPSTYAR